MQFDGRQRVTIQNVEPEIDSGDFPAKRVVGESVRVRAHVFTDGHDRIRASLLYRAADESAFLTVPMQPLGNDCWEAAFMVDRAIAHIYTVEGFIDRFATWQEDLRKKIADGQDVVVELQVGAELVGRAAGRARGDEAQRLTTLADRLGRGGREALTSATSEELTTLMAQHADRSLISRYSKELVIEVDRPKARFSSWYEVFPRSLSPQEGRHGTFQDAEKHLSRIAKMGFDVLYLPPIHPIGRTNRKGRNNSPQSEAGDPGSPWAIGAQEGGHKSVHPELGTIEDFRHLVQAAEGLGIEVALDIAFQCSPDHPYVKEHPEWFLWRPDGSIQYAENPPKKYQDVVPFNFETDDWQALWEELRSVFLFWAEQGVKIFRVDNPHTKPFRFWEWTIAQVRQAYPDALFLSEAFTRPQVMGRLAKIGFTQSYTYFTWRNSKWELMEYLTELTSPPVSDYLRPNFWPNTPDILPEFLQYGGRPAFLIRACLAAMLSSNYGIYGPAFELCVADAVDGREEYRDSEKYEIKQWDWNKKGNIADVVSLLNRIRRENPALQETNNLRFLDVDNDYILSFAKGTSDMSNLIVVVVNLDPFHRQSGFVRLPLDELMVASAQPYLMHELIGDDRFIWQGEHNYVELDPQVLPFQVFRVQRRLRREVDFDYYL